VSPVRYELSFYVTEDGILHSHRRENLISHIDFPCLEVHIFLTDDELLLIRSLQ
jgi:hypothetical protein